MDLGVSTGTGGSADVGGSTGSIGGEDSAGLSSAFRTGLRATRRTLGEGGMKWGSWVFFVFFDAMSLGSGYLYTPVYKAVEPYPKSPRKNHRCRVRQVDEASNPKKGKFGCDAIQAL